MNGDFTTPNTCLLIQEVVSTLSLFTLINGGFDATAWEEALARGPGGQGLSLAKIEKAWAALIGQTGLEALALLLGERYRPRMNIVNCLVMCSPTLGLALDRLPRYWRLVCQCTEVLCEKTHEEVRLEFRGEGDRPIDRHSIEYRMAGWLTWFRWLAGQPIVPREVAFRFERPAYGAEYDRIFRAPVRFGQAANWIAFDRAATDLALLDADPQLAQRLTEYAERLLQGSRGAEALTVRLRDALREALPRGEAALKAVAPRLNMSARTLHRHLREEGTTFQEVLWSLRGELAREYLRDGNLSLAEIAFRLGYSTPANFHRAFKRATGKTPARYRQQLARPPPAADGPA